jgi:predicted nucleic acid-binding protein
VGLIVADSSLLIAIIDSNDPCHTRGVEELAAVSAADDVLIPAVAFSEAVAFPYRAGSAQGRAIERQLRTIGEITPVTVEIASRAARIRAQRQVRLPDALIIATGIESNSREILTFETMWKGIDRRVRVLSAGVTEP